MWCGFHPGPFELFYDADCSLIAVFGDGLATPGALFRSLVAIDKLGDNYLASGTAESAASLTVFAPTDYS
ncbi:MAG: hypothetical protein ACLU9S_01875 [Oscillospiraceae bacterium]